MVYSMQISEDFKELVLDAFDGSEQRYFLEYLETGDLSRFEHYLEPYITPLDDGYVVDQINKGLEAIIMLRNYCEKRIKEKKVWDEFLKYKSSQNTPEQSVIRK